MERYGIALDLGTSGVRGQAVDLAHGEIVSTAITSQPPMPGGNVMDHLHFAVETSADGRSNVAHDLMIDTVNKVVSALGIPRERVERVAISGNPIQLSLFQKMEIRDLAFAGKSKLASLGVEMQPAYGEDHHGWRDPRVRPVPAGRCWWCPRPSVTRSARTPWP